MKVPHVYFLSLSFAGASLYARFPGAQGARFLFAPWVDRHEGPWRPAYVGVDVGCIAGVGCSAPVAGMDCGEHAAELTTSASATRETAHRFRIIFSSKAQGYALWKLLWQTGAHAVLTCVPVATHSCFHP